MSFEDPLDVHEAMVNTQAVVDRTQKFFEQLAAEARKPHFGAIEFTRALLVRAEEAGLYVPTKEQS